jgi:hypothetical protein
MDKSTEKQEETPNILETITVGYNSEGKLYISGKKSITNRFLKFLIDNGIVIKKKEYNSPCG